MTAGDLEALIRDVVGADGMRSIDEGRRAALGALAYRHGPSWDDDALGDELARLIDVLRRNSDAPLELGFYSVASALLKKLHDDHGADPCEVLRSIAADWSSAGRRPAKRRRPLRAKDGGS